jgi:hypothetical protein
MKLLSYHFQESTEFRWIPPNLLTLECLYDFQGWSQRIVLRERANWMWHGRSHLKFAVKTSRKFIFFSWANYYDSVRHCGHIILNVLNNVKICLKVQRGSTLCFWFLHIMFDAGNKLIQWTNIDHKSSKCWANIRNVCQVIYEKMYVKFLPWYLNWWHIFPPGYPFSTIFFSKNL